MYDGETTKEVARCENDQREDPTMEGKDRQVEWEDPHEL